LQFGALAVLSLQIELAVNPHFVAGGLDFLERDGAGGRQGDDLAVQDVVRGGQNQLQGIHIGRLIGPGLRLVLKGQPEAHAVGDGTVHDTGKERMGIDFRGKQAAERQDCVRVIKTAGGVPDRILLQGNQVVGDGFLEAGGREERLTPGLAEGDARLGGQQVLKRPHTAGLSRIQPLA
jgi:hypothetical protein